MQKTFTCNGTALHRLSATYQLIINKCTSLTTIKPIGSSYKRVHQHRTAAPTLLVQQIDFFKYMYFKVYGGGDI